MIGALLLKGPALRLGFHYRPLRENAFKDCIFGADEIPKRGTVPYILPYPSNYLRNTVLSLICVLQLEIEGRCLASMTEQGQQQGAVEDDGENEVNFFKDFSEFYPEELATLVNRVRHRHL